MRHRIFVLFRDGIVSTHPWEMPSVYAGLGRMDAQPSRKSGATLVGSNFSPDLSECRNECARGHTDSNIVRPQAAQGGRTRHLRNADGLP